MDENHDGEPVSSKRDIRPTAGGQGRKTSGQSKPSPRSRLATAGAETARPRIWHVRQIELETQNEELRRSNSELESFLTRYFEIYNLCSSGLISRSMKTG